MCASSRWWVGRAGEGGTHHFSHAYRTLAVRGVGCWGHDHSREGKWGGQHNPNPKACAPNLVPPPPLPPPLPPCPP